MNEVAQSWDIGLMNSKFVHEYNGSTPYSRLNAKPVINACHDALGVSENLYFIGTTVPAATRCQLSRLSIHGCTMTRPTAGDTDMPYYGRPITKTAGCPAGKGSSALVMLAAAIPRPLTVTYPDTDLIVMNVFDPCAQWQYAAPPESRNRPLRPRRRRRPYPVPIRSSAPPNCRRGRHRESAV